jgi:hypothetical protein
MSYLNIISNIISNTNNIYYKKNENATTFDKINNCFEKGTIPLVKKKKEMSCSVSSQDFEKELSSMMTERVKSVVTWLEQNLHSISPEINVMDLFFAHIVNERLEGFVDIGSFSIFWQSFFSTVLSEIEVDSLGLVNTSSRELFMDRIKSGEASNIYVSTNDHAQYIRVIPSEEGYRLVVFGLLGGSSVYEMERSYTEEEIASILEITSIQDLGIRQDSLSRVIFEDGREPKHRVEFFENMNGGFCACRNLFNCILYSLPEGKKRMFSRLLQHSLACFFEKSEDYQATLAQGIIPFGGKVARYKSSHDFKIIDKKIESVFSQINNIIKPKDYYNLDSYIIKSVIKQRKDTC